jgi:hypothetical protein
MLEEGWWMCRNASKHPTQKVQWSLDPEEVKRGELRGYYCSDCVNWMCRPWIDNPGVKSGAYEFECLACRGQLNRLLPEFGELRAALRDLRINRFKLEMTRQRGDVDSASSEEEDGEEGSVSSSESFIDDEEEGSESSSDDDEYKGPSAEHEVFRPPRPKTAREAMMVGFITGDPTAVMDMNATTFELAGRGYTGNAAGAARAREAISHAMNGTLALSNPFAFVHKGVCFMCGATRMLSVGVLDACGKTHGSAGMGQYCAKVFLAVRALYARLFDVRASMLVAPEKWAKVDALEFVRARVVPMMSALERAVCVE